MAYSSKTCSRLPLKTDLTTDKVSDQQLVATVPASNTTNKPDWRVPFIKYLTDGSGYTDRVENERLMRCSKQYLLIDGKLWRKNTKEEILMKCITQEEGEHLLDQIHSGSCGNHAASRTLVVRLSEPGSIGRQQWPTQRS